MAWDRFLIAPYDANSGLQTNVKPWLISDTGYSTLNNAYIFRGRVRKRFGSTLLTGDPLTSRFRVGIGSTNGSGNISVTLPGYSFNIGQLISVGTALFTVVALGTPAALKRSDGLGATATLNTTTGALIINSAPAITAAFYYPALPVIGLSSYESDFVVLEPAIGFDTEFAYQFTIDHWERIGTAVWHGNTSSLMWTANYRATAAQNSLLFATAFDGFLVDPIRYWDGATWTDFQPVINAAGDRIRTAQLIIPFKDRLLLIGVIEEVSGVPQVFLNRLRYSANGAATTATAYRQDIPGQGNFLDCTTQERVITCGIIKDHLIVQFETSVYELVYTNNEVLPFRWQQLNSELGAFSVFSAVLFDKALLSLGETGIHACNGVNVERIDQLIPDIILDVPPTGLQEKIVGIRDYTLEMVYWLLPLNTTPTQQFCNKVLVYNYKTGTWAFNDDTFTFFGYFQDTQNVIAGNQEGYTFNILGDIYRNAPSLQITNLTISIPTATIVAIDHNLAVGDYVLIENCIGITAMNGLIFPVISVIDRNTFIVNVFVAPGTYRGGGTLARVSVIDIQSKQYNFYTDDDRNAAIQKTDFFVTATATGEISVDYLIGSSPTSMVAAGIASGSIVGNSILSTAPYPSVPFEATQVRLWHPTYMQADGESIQIRLYLSPLQMINPEVSLVNFELNAMAIYATPTANRMQ